MNSTLGADAKKLTLVVSIGTGLAVGAAVLCYRAVHNYLYWNSPFVEAGTISSLYVYPVKALRGNKVDYLDCTIRGGRFCENFDRKFLVVDELNKHIYLTALIFPRLILLEANVENGVLKIVDPSKIIDGKVSQVCCELAEVCARNDVRRAKMYGGGETDGLDCGDKIGDFMTEFLQLCGKSRLRLLYFADGMYTARNFQTAQKYWNNPVAYSYLAAYMAFGSGSIDHLNSRLCVKGESPVDERCMRPNIVVDNPIPFDEDRWLQVRIGDEAEFACYMPCTRCILTTVDPNSGKKSATMEPLKELRQYRLAPTGKLLDLYEQSPILGVYMALVRPGRISVGDPVFIRYKPTPF